MIRLLLCLIVTIIFFTIYQINLLIFLIIKIFNKEKAYWYSQKATCLYLFALEFCAGVRTDFIGEENLSRAYNLNIEKYDSKKGLVFISNHRSIFDVICGYKLARTITGFIAKKELGKVPFFKFWFDNDHCLLLDRKDIRQGMKVILKGIEYINDGISMWVFPEGTRAKDNITLNEFRDGAFALATKTNAIIVPIIFINTDNIFENHFPFIRKTNIKIIVDEPIDTSLLSNDDKKNLPHIMYSNFKSIIENNIN